MKKKNQLIHTSSLNPEDGWMGCVLVLDKEAPDYPSVKDSEAGAWTLRQKYVMLWNLSSRSLW